MDTLVASTRWVITHVCISGVPGLEHFNERAAIEFHKVLRAHYRTLLIKGEVTREEYELIHKQMSQNMVQLGDRWLRQFEGDVLDDCEVISFLAEKWNCLITAYELDLVSLFDDYLWLYRKFGFESA
ncbi:MAG: hypothetical protein HC808_12085 [Candidatus Competibacteraceae bacterium]|nr:hypothetical protein [Candidatus Competibacteraceae bacterium]